MAIHHGWEPKGTKLNENDWDGNYLLNCAQMVEKEDAKNLAKALRSSMIDVPDIRIGYISKTIIDRYDLR